MKIRSSPFSVFVVAMKDGRMDAKDLAIVKVLPGEPANLRCKYAISEWKPDVYECGAVTVV